MQGANAVKLNERPVKVGRVAEITGYSAGYIYQLVSAGKIPFHKHGGAGTKGAVRFYESEITDWIKNGWGFSPSQDDISAQTVHESVVLKQVEEWLTLRHIWHMRCNNAAGKAQSGQFMRSFTCNGHAVNGVSDIYAVKNGTSIWIECKRPVGGKVSEAQRNFLDAMNRNGAVGIVVNSIESLEEQLREAGVL